MNYIIKPMQTVDEIDGKGYVHYKSWQETYVGLIDAEYLKNMTEEKCKTIAHTWTDNILVAKDGDKVIGLSVTENTEMTHSLIVGRCTLSMCLPITTVKRLVMN